ncbi:unnamed protein product [Prorocentrum cordatum]|uniref:GB1/RHD3-type G domain-containing protein n=1 Tax=Prorocentrum cordatum TaxID=2364126 RepID=A0ABN9V855_9DINO|nr:unnamed protein product [Polarella glacialis]
MAGVLDSARAHGGSPVLGLVRIDDAGRCHLGERAVEVLGQIQGSLAVVGVAGLYRTGKSFLLNRLLGLQDGFEVGPTVNACTKGLWMWDRPVQLAPGYHCIFIDTEGLGSAQRTASCDMQIFSLCVLLSSYFIYNSMGAIDEQSISDLNLVLHLAKHIHVKSSPDGRPTSAKDLSGHFPSLLWVLRDFFLRLVDDRGNPITEKEYLEGALTALPGQEDKNRVRDELKALFSERDCATLVRPVSEESELRTVQRLPFEALRHRFRIQVDSLVAKVYPLREAQGRERRAGDGRHAGGAGRGVLQGHQRQRHTDHTRGPYTRRGPPCCSPSCGRA